MHDPTQRAEGSFDGLDGTLRKAVEQVRGEPVPQRAMRRSLDRAHALKRPRFQPPQRSRSLLAGVALAATLLLGLFLCPSSSDTQRENGQKYARRRSDISQLDGDIARINRDI